MNRKFEVYFQIAGIVIRVVGPQNWEPKHYKALSTFQINPKAWDYEINIEIVEKLSEPNGQCIYRELGLMVFQAGEVLERYIGPVKDHTGQAYQKVTQSGNVYFVELKQEYLRERILSKDILNSMQAEHLFAEQQGFVLHASVINYKGKAILFTAPSGTGKSTQADLWKNFRGAKIINGDRIGVRMINNEIMVCGIPFSGSSKICENTQLPLGAIVYLSQNIDNKIERLNSRLAFFRIWEGCSVNIWNKKDVESCSNVVAEVINKIPIFHLACRKDESAVEILERTLEMEGY